MSALSRPAFRWSVLLGTWALMGAVVWIVTVQVFLLALNPFCHVQRPGVSRLEVVSVDRNTDSQITDFVTAKQGDETRVLTLSKAEAAPTPRPRERTGCAVFSFAMGPIPRSSLRLDCSRPR